MKILMVNKFLYPRGGAESYMLKIGEEFKKQGNEVEYFGMYDDKNTVFNSAGQYTRNMDFHTNSLKKLLYPFKIIYSFEARKKIGMVLDKFKPDVIHLNNINFQLTPSVIDAAKKRNIPVIWTLHDYQLVCPNHLLYTENGVCEKCVGRKKTDCIKNKCIHSSFVKSVIGVLEAKFYKNKGTYKKVDAFIAPSEFLYKKLTDDNKQLFLGKTFVLHNFVNKRDLPQNAKSNFDFPYVAFAGRLSAEKGTGVLAQTAKLLPEVKFVVMGNGPEEKAFNGISNIIKTGFVTGEELDINIAKAKAVAVPSVCFENCPMTILEAQMFGVPCVTMNMGGMAELVEDNVTGVLSKSVSPKDFAKAVKKILSNEEALKNMKENCLAKAKTSLTAEDYCKKLTEIYKNIINTVNTVNKNN